jgi:hypothetical protein
MADAEFVTNEPASPGLSDAVLRREAWSTPLVIASQLRAAKAHVGHGQDGSSPGYGPYGS